MDGDILEFPKPGGRPDPSPPNLNEDAAAAPAPPIIVPQLPIGDIDAAALAGDEPRLAQATQDIFLQANRAVRAYCHDVGGLQGEADFIRKDADLLKARLHKTERSHTRRTAEPHPSGEPPAKRTERWLLSTLALAAMAIVVGVTAGFIVEHGVFETVEHIAIAALFTALTMTGGVMGLFAIYKKLLTDDAQRRLVLISGACAVSFLILWLMTVAFLAYASKYDQGLMGRPLPEWLNSNRSIAAGLLIIFAVPGEVLGGFVLKVLVTESQASPFQREVVPNVEYADLKGRFDAASRRLCQLERAIGARRDAEADLARGAKAFADRCLLELAAAREAQRAAAVVAMHNTRRKMPALTA